MLVEAAWAAARSPGPLRAFFKRVAVRRGQHIAAVATARKLAMIIWHMLGKEEDYIWTRPALCARKLRSMELRSGLPSRRGPHRGAAYEYNRPEKRAQDRERVETAEREYHRFTSAWKPKRRSGRGLVVTQKSG
jgi:transposase